MFNNSYNTILLATQAEYKDKGSRFIAYAYPVFTELEAKEKINQLKKEHPSANHHCWALVLGYNKEFEKSSDDREPNNTAGKPILRAILSKNITYTLVVVVRYFGGKLLGVSGLINAYGNAAQEALAKAQLINKEITEKYFVLCSYEQEHLLYKILKNDIINMQLCKSKNNEQGLIFETSKQKAEMLLAKLKEATFITYQL